MTRKTATPAIGARGERRPRPSQMDMFATRRAAGAPDWPDLPKEAQEALVDLMTRLILDHAQAAAPTTAGTGHDR